jgi:uncharacterized membrane protein YqaE (UPF0057 family)
MWKIMKVILQEVVPMYFLSIVFPPLAVLMAKKPFQAFFNLILTMLFWLPGVIHAILVVNEYKADQRLRRT